MTIYLYSGDWDDVIPFSYTVDNIKKLSLKQSGEQEGWKIGDQHAGFKRKYKYKERTLKLYTIKGAGH